MKVAGHWYPMFVYAQYVLNVVEQFWTETLFSGILNFLSKFFATFKLKAQFIKPLLINNKTISIISMLTSFQMRSSSRNNHQTRPNHHNTRVNNNGLNNSPSNNNRRPKTRNQATQLPNISSHGSFSPVIDLDPFNQHPAKIRPRNHQPYLPRTSSSGSIGGIRRQDYRGVGSSRVSMSSVENSLEDEATLLEDSDYQDEQATQRTRSSVQHHLKERDGEYIFNIQLINVQCFSNRF